jgi:hypothetical protein
MALKLIRRLQFNFSRRINAAHRSRRGLVDKGAWNSQLLTMLQSSHSYINNERPYGEALGVQNWINWKTCTRGISGTVSLFSLAGRAAKCFSLQCRLSLWLQSTQTSACVCVSSHVFIYTHIYSGRVHIRDLFVLLSCRGEMKTNYMCMCACLLNKKVVFPAAAAAADRNGSCSWISCRLNNECACCRAWIQWGTFLARAANKKLLHVVLLLILICTLTLAHTTTLVQIN